MGCESTCRLMSWQAFDAVGFWSARLDQRGRTARRGVFPPGYFSSWNTIPTFSTPAGHPACGPNPTQPHLAAHPRSPTRPGSRQSWDPTVVARPFAFAIARSAPGSSPATVDCPSTTTGPPGTVIGTSGRGPNDEAPAPADYARRECLVASREDAGQLRAHSRTLWQKVAAV